MYMEKESVSTKEIYWYCYNLLASYRGSAFARSFLKDSFTTPRPIFTEKSTLESC